MTVGVSSRRCSDVSLGAKTGSIGASTLCLLYPQILLQKSIWDDERKFLEPLMHFARGDVGDPISFHPKSTTDLPSGAEK
jgi:hypothetical protein